MELVLAVIVAALVGAAVAAVLLRRSRRAPVQVDRAQRPGDGVPAPPDPDSAQDQEPEAPPRGGQSEQTASPEPARTGSPAATLTSDPVASVAPPVQTPSREPPDTSPDPPELHGTSLAPPGAAITSPSITGALASRPVTHVTPRSNGAVNGTTPVQVPGPARPGAGGAPDPRGGTATAGNAVAPGARAATPPAVVSQPALPAASAAADAAAKSFADRRAEMDAELKERRAEIGRIEERLLGKEQTVSVRLAEAERTHRKLEDRARNLDNSALQLKAAKQLQLRELERIAGLSASQAKQILLRELQDELRHDSARLVRQAQEETKREADRRVRSILATSMQRIAGGHAVETTVSVVALQSDDLKGRIIGREGRNIRALETLTGIDFIIDDTPSAVILSGFDGVRREIARLTLEKLLQDGRIHPARIEEAYEQSRTEIDSRIVQVGEEATFEAKVGTVHPELVKLLGRLHYRTSYGQNVLAHSIECAHLAASISDELGAGSKTARRAALLHDIGKAVSHEIEGPHALVGGNLARRYGESDAVAHAMEAHHGEVQMQTVEAVIVQVADSLSGARPGARGESLEQYVKRLRDLEAIATRHAGVEKVYAMQAGREIRVVVRPQDVDDDTAALISHKIARDLEHELEYPGQIKVTVIRESRSVDFAK